jgi:hypothetical protein
MRIGRRDGARASLATGPWHQRHCSRRVAGLTCALRRYPGWALQQCLSALLPRARVSCDGGAALLGGAWCAQLCASPGAADTGIRRALQLARSKVILYEGSKATVDYAALSAT